eukprot:257619-Pleurochrysis_carterae.AAC.3
MLATLTSRRAGVARLADWLYGRLRRRTTNGRRGRPCTGLAASVTSNARAARPACRTRALAYSSRRLVSGQPAETTGEMSKIVYSQINANVPAASPKISFKVYN